ncbi:hypothetical protein BO71DRAFT_320550 [Aspergillus ellipticus CBS 707.79]|uniref:Uncharacterized protein n=1 Tax=Aspergillus ellipticus CBS 707.79 TaxID=1448320 RepID=A0A319EXS2_9EURO|nr:hypothetical protein BO71DRAFT_320550 [Aspergillus ellipticus CBS 707.79]
MPHGNLTNCWQKLFNSAIIAAEPSICMAPSYTLHVDFGIMCQISAIQYVVNIGSGLVLMGYSSALIPMKELDDETLLWHVELCPHNKQFDPFELQTIRSSWLRTLNLNYLRIKRAVVGSIPPPIPQSCSKEEACPM